MSLLNKYKTNSSLANDGVWFELHHIVNPDGTIPAYKLARNTRQNKDYVSSHRSYTKDYIEDTGEFNVDKLTEEKATEIEVNVFVDSLLRDWRYVDPDGNGSYLKYTKENAFKFFNNPDWHDLFRELMKKCSSAASYRYDKLEEEVKNS